MPTLPDARVLLTGATGGIGTAIAKKLATNGAQLLLHGRNTAELDRLHSELSQLTTVRIVEADLVEAKGRTSIIEAAHQFPGGINRVIHNAGWNQFGWFEDQEEASIQQTIQINLLAPVLLTHELLPLLHLQRQAQLVFITSTFGRIGHSGYATYASAKFGINGFAESLRRELADSDISISTLSPRATSTALNSANVVAMNNALHVQMDSPQAVADAVLDTLLTRAARKQLGWPEKLFVHVNAVFPRLVDRALGKQLPIVKRFARS
jgi:short-subunit dehydrogenase